MGCQELLDQPLTAFFASRQCPGQAIRAAMDWALQQVLTKDVVISGFHSPLEQSVLKVLMQARSPLIVLLARPVTGAKLNPDWLGAIGDDRMAVISVGTKIQRLTNTLAMQRNDWVAKLASNIVVAHANPAGGLAKQCATWMTTNAVRFL